MDDVWLRMMGLLRDIGDVPGLAEVFTGLLKDVDVGVPLVLRGEGLFCFADMVLPVGLPALFWAPESGGVLTFGGRD